MPKAKAFKRKVNPKGYHVRKLPHSSTGAIDSEYDIMYKTITDNKGRKRRRFYEIQDEDNITLVSRKWVEKNYPEVDLPKPFPRKRRAKKAPAGSGLRLAGRRRPRGGAYRKAPAVFGQWRTFFDNYRAKHPNMAYRTAQKKASALWKKR